MVEMPIIPALCICENERGKLELKFYLTCNETEISSLRKGK